MSSDIQLIRAALIIADDARRFVSGEFTGDGLKIHDDIERDVPVAIAALERLEDELQGSFDIAKLPRYTSMARNAALEEAATVAEEVAETVYEFDASLDASWRSACEKIEGRIRDLKTKEET